VFQWSGVTSSNFATSTNWVDGTPAPSGNAPGTADARISVQNGLNNPLIYSAAQGNTIYATTAGVGTGRSLFIGSGGNGSMEFTGGTFDSRGVADDGMGASATGTLTMSGGAYLKTAGGSTTFLVVHSGGGSGTLTLNGGTFSVNTLRFGDLASDGSGTGTVNLNVGGLLEARTIVDTGTAVSNFNFNGGTLRALDNGTLMSAMNSATVQAGGAVVDTNSFNVLITANLLNGGGGLTKNGAGTLTLTGSNAYAGTTTINTGILQIGNNAGAGTLGTGNVVNNATLEFNRTGTLSVANDISGSGGIVKNASGTVTLSGNSTYAGTTTVNTGILAIQSNTALGNTTGGTTVAAGAALHLLGNITVTGESLSITGDGVGATGGALRNTSGANTWAGSIAADASGSNFARIGADSGSTLNITGNITTSGTNSLVFQATGDINVSGNITGTAGLIKSTTGAGMLTLSGNNSYAGATLVSNGVLRIESNTALGGTTAGTTVSDSNRLELANNITVTGENLTISGTGGNNVGALQNFSGNNTWNGNVLLASSTTRIGSFAGSLTIGGVIDDGASTFDLNIRNSGSAPTPGIEVVVSGANTYGGATNVIVGTLRLAGGNNRLPTTTFLNLGANGNVDGQLDIGGVDQTVGGIANLGNTSGSTVTNSSATASTFTINNSSSNTYSGKFSGSTLNVVKSGSGNLILTGNNSAFTGSFTNNNGQVILSTVNSASANAAWNINASGAQLLLDLSATNQTVSLGSLSGVAGAVLRNGGSIVGTNTFSVGALGTNTVFAGNVTNGVSANVLTALTKVGGGTLSLTGNNTYTGATTIQGGTLQLDAGGVLTGTPVVNVGNASGSGRLLITSNVNHTIGVATTNVLLGSGGNQGTLDFQATAGTTVIVPDSLIVGNTASGSSGVVNHTGAGTLQVNGPTIVGNAAGTTGQYNISAGTLNANHAGGLIVGASGAGTLSVSGTGIVNAPDLIVAQSTGSTGNVNQSGGTINVTNLTTYVVGQAGTATVSQTGGTTNVGSATGGGNMHIANSGATGTYTLGNGPGPAQLNVYGNMVVGNGGAGTFNLRSNGTLNFGDTANGTQSAAGLASSSLTIGAGDTFSFTAGTLMNVTTIDVSQAPGNAFTQDGGLFVIGVNGGLAITDGIGAESVRASTTIVGGDFVQTAGTLAIDIFGPKYRSRGGESLGPTDPASNPIDGLITHSDLLHVQDGTATLDGTLAINANGFRPLPWAWYDVLVADEIIIGDDFDLVGINLWRIIDDPTTPGRQILQVATPEPASVLLWAGIGLAIALVVAVRRRSSR
jgi:autotransporter-associated beta strand protein